MEKVSRKKCEETRTCTLRGAGSISAYGRNVDASFRPHLSGQLIPQVKHDEKRGLFIGSAVQG